MGVEVGYHLQKSKQKVWKLVDTTEDFNDQGFARYKLHFENVLDPQDRFSAYPDGLVLMDFVELTEMEVVAWMAR